MGWVNVSPDTQSAESVTGAAAGVIAQKLAVGDASAIATPPLGAGQIPVGTSSGNSAITPGAAGTVLTSQGAGVVPHYAANPAGFADPLTTKGDIIAHGVSTTRFPVGPDGTFISADSTAALGVSYQGAVNAYNVKLSGCKVDGVTDDTTNFLAALTHVGNGGTVYVPAGTMMLQQAFTWPAFTNQTVILDNKAVVKQIATAGSDAFIKFQNAFTELLGGTIDGNLTNCPNTFAAVWVIGTADDSRIENVTVQNFNGDGIRCSRLRTWIRNNRIVGTGNGSGINIAQQNISPILGVVVANNIITQTGTANGNVGINLLGVNGGNQINGTVIMGNYISIPQASGGFAIQNWDNVNYSEIVGNYCSGGNANISIADSDYVKVVGNTCTLANATGLGNCEGGGNWGTYTGNIFDGGGFLLDGVKVGNTITGNVFRNVTQANHSALSIAANTQTFWTITGNTFISNGSGGGSYDVNMAGNGSGIVANNVFTSTNGIGSIGTGGASNISITGNLFSKGTGTVAIRVEGTGTPVIIANNFGIGYGGAANFIAYIVSRPASAQVHDNIPRGQDDYASGVATVADGGTIAHGLPVTPTSVRVTSTNGLHTAAVTAISSTTLTVGLKVATSGAAVAVAEPVYWSAEIQS